MADQVVTPAEDLDGGTQVIDNQIDENANADTLRPGSGTAGAGDSRSKTIADVVANLTTLSADDLNGFAASLAQIGKEAEGVGLDGKAGSNKNSISAKGDPKAGVKKIVAEDLAALFTEEDGLSSKFISEATTLFEAAVTARTELERVAIEEEFENRLTESTTSMVSEFSERLDTYLDYIAEKWLEENRVAVEAGVKTELTEGFIAGLRDLFAEHYIDVPEDKVDVVEALTAEVNDLQSQLNEQINENIAINSVNEKAQLMEVVNDISEGLADSDAERLATLAEDLDYDTIEDFSAKVKLIRENFFGKPATTSSTGLVIEEVGLLEDEEAATPTTTGDARMDAYVSAILKDVRK